jgi:hypothetical protein
MSSAAGDLRARPSVTDAADQFADEAVLTEILAEWRERLRGSPDVQPREDARGQRERSLTRALLTAADAREGSPQAAEARSKLAMIAALYAADQPRERLDPGALCEELAHLRHAYSLHLRKQNLGGSTATRRLRAFDRALKLAISAALTGGYHCSEEGEAELKNVLPAIHSDAMPTRQTSDR